MTLPKQIERNLLVILSVTTVLFCAQVEAQPAISIQSSRLNIQQKAQPTPTPPPLPTEEECMMEIVRTITAALLGFAIDNTSNYPDPTEIQTMEDAALIVEDVAMTNCEKSSALDVLFGGAYALTISGEGSTTNLTVTSLSTENTAPTDRRSAVTGGNNSLNKLIQTFGLNLRTLADARRILISIPKKRAPKTLEVGEPESPIAGLNATGIN